MRLCELIESKLQKAQAEVDRLSVFETRIESAKSKGEQEGIWREFNVYRGKEQNPLVEAHERIKEAELLKLNFEGELEKVAKTELFSFDSNTNKQICVSSLKYDDDGYIVEAMIMPFGSSIDLSGLVRCKIIDIYRSNVSDVVWPKDIESVTVSDCPNIENSLDFSDYSNLQELEVTNVNVERLFLSKTTKSFSVLRCTGLAKDFDLSDYSGLENVLMSNLAISSFRLPNSLIVLQVMNLPNILDCFDLSDYFNLERVALSNLNINEFIMPVGVRFLEFSFLNSILPAILDFGDYLSLEFLKLFKLNLSKLVLPDSTRVLEILDSHETEEGLDLSACNGLECIKLGVADKRPLILSPVLYDRYINGGLEIDKDMTIIQ